MIIIDDKSFDRLPEKKYFSKDLNLYVNSVNSLCATGGAGKSMLMAHIAVSSLTGKSLFNTLNVAKSNKVLYLDQEMTNEQFETRAIQFARGIGFSGELHLDRKQISRIKIKEEEDWKRLSNAIEGYELVIIDSMKSISDADENSGEIEPLIKYLKQQAEKYRCCIIFISHRGKHTGSEVQTSRGHSSIYDSLDNQMDLTLDSDYCTNECEEGCWKHNIFKLVSQKSRDDAPHKPIRYTIEWSGKMINHRNCMEMIKMNICEMNAKGQIEASIAECIDRLGNQINQINLSKEMKRDKSRLVVIVNKMIQDNDVMILPTTGKAIIYSLTVSGYDKYIRKQ